MFPDLVFSYLLPLTEVSSKKMWSSESRGFRGLSIETRQFLKVSLLLLLLPFIAVSTPASAKIFHMFTSPIQLNL